jgi:hypothetical protein
MDKKDRIIRKNLIYCNIDLVLIEKKLLERQKYGKKLQLEHQEKKRIRKLQNQVEQEALNIKKKKLIAMRESKPRIKAESPLDEDDDKIFGKRPQTARQHLEMRRAIFDRYKRMF